MPVKNRGKKERKKQQQQQAGTWLVLRCISIQTIRSPLPSSAKWILAIANHGECTRLNAHCTVSAIFSIDKWLNVINMEIISMGVLHCWTHRAPGLFHSMYMIHFTNSDYILHDLFIVCLKKGIDNNFQLDVSPDKTNQRTKCVVARFIRVWQYLGRWSKWRYNCDRIVHAYRVYHLHFKCKSFNSNAIS